MKKLLIVFSVIISALLAGCSSDGIDYREKGTGGISDGQMILSVDVNGIGTELVTRGSIAPETGEDVIESLYLFFFEPVSDKSGKCIDYIKVDGPLAMNTPIPISLDGTSLLSSEAYNVLAVANIDDDQYVGANVADWCNDLVGKTERYVMQNTLARVEDISNERNRIAPNKILMNGRSSVAENQGRINMTLTRNVSRFDVHNNMRESYNLISVSLWNAYRTSSIFGEGIIDYSSSVSRVRRFYGLDNTSNETVDGQDGKGKMLGNISGGLYTFENQVAAPGKNDKLTTCLIIGLENRATGVVSYYRANIHPNDGAQILKRNNVYRVTIMSVNGGGDSSEELAYSGINNDLEYVINYWDLDDNGLIQHDQNSILSLPTKTVRIDREGGEHTLSVVTFSHLPAPAPLSLKSQTWEPATNDIQASLSGNTLTITASQMTLDETERRGVIVVSYAGLEASINVIQSGTVNTYLRVILPDGGIPNFAPFAGIPTGLIQVQASGPWSAKLLMEGFSFSSSISPAAAITNIKHNTSGLVMDNKFQVWSHTANPNSSSREAFVIVSLDEDPTNYAAVVMLNQKPTGGISLAPSQATVTFNGHGTGLASVSGNNTNEFFVLPSTEDDGQGGVIVHKWTYEIIADGANDDRDKFRVINVNMSETDTDGNSLKVEAMGMNTATRQYKAKLRIALQDQPTVYTDVALVQQSYSFTITPSSFDTPLSVKGAETALISVNGESNMQWTASIVTETTTANATLTNHEAVIVDENGSPLNTSVPQDMTQKFRVVFPKVYYGNHEMTIRATLKMQLVGTEITISVPIQQEALTAKNVNIHSVHDAYGAIHRNNYSKAQRDMLQSSIMFGSAPAPVYVKGGITLPTTYSYLTASQGASNSSITWVHANQYSEYASAYWANIESWRMNNDGILFIVHEENHQNALNNTNSTIYKFGWKNGDTAVSEEARTPKAGITNTKIGKYIYQDGPFGAVSTSLVIPNVDGISKSINLESQTGKAIAILGSDQHASIIIDPANRIAFLGESQFFSPDGGSSVVTVPPTDDRSRLLANVLAYCVLTSQYGSHFSDLFVD